MRLDRKFRSAVNMDVIRSHLTCHLVLVCCLVFAVDAQISDVRLVGGSTDNEGRVEVRHNGVWGTLCGVAWYGYWNHRDARVVCRTLGYNGVFSRVWYGKFGSGQGSFFDLRCNGTESSIVGCSAEIVTDSSCTHSRDAGVICSHDDSRSAAPGISLEDGSQSNEGRVEVLHDEEWKTVYDPNFYWSEEAQVVCRMLGYDGAFASTYNNEFGPGQGSVLDNLGCDGTEQTLGECSMQERSSSSHSNDAGVVCYQERNPGNYRMRLTGSSSTASRGRVEVFYNGQWGTICGRVPMRLGRGGAAFYFDHREASVICKQLGFDGYSYSYGISGNEYGDSPDPVLLMIVCSGSETSVDQCDTNWGPTSACYSGYENPWVECSGEIDVGILDEAILTSPNYPSNYGNLVGSIWKVVTSQYHWITLAFTHFDTEAGYDFLKVYAENTSSFNDANLLQSLSGSTLPDPITLNAPHVWIRFTSDGSSTSTGFRLTVTLTDGDECSLLPCQNGATCNDHVKNYTCNCADGFVGTNCETEIRQCSSSSCQNGGTCVDERDGSYSCTCVEGFEGHDCGIQIPLCSSSTCLNGGTCGERDGSYNCTCVKGFEGTHCGIVTGNRTIGTREALKGIVTALDQLMMAIKQLMVSSSLAAQDQ